MKNILMILTNAFMPDPRPYTEARSLLNAGYSVKIMCWDRGENLPGKEFIDGIALERIRVRSTHGRGNMQMMFLSLFWWKVICRGIKENPDIVYAHDLDALIPAVIIRFLKRKRLVFDSHEVYSKMLGRNIWPPIKILAEWMEKVLVKKADLVIVTCEAMKELYLSYGAKDVVIVGNWKDSDNFRLEESRILAEKNRLGIQKRLVITYIANLGPERVIRPLLEAAEEDPAIYVVIGGDGVQKSMVLDAAGSSPNIKYLGYVSPEKVALYTALSDVIYYGYDRNAGMAEFNAPNKLFEALAAGCAFLGGNFGEMGRILEEEKCGIALDVFTKDSVRWAIGIMKDPVRLGTFKNNALRAGVEKYNWRKSEKNLLQAVTRLI